MEKHLCSIVICSHNRSELLLQTVCNILENADIPKNFELHIVLNACVDDSKIQLMKLGQHSVIKIFIHEESRAGKSYALNYAINNIQTDYIFFLDDDQILESNYLNKLGSILNSNPECPIITGFLMPAWDGTEPKWVHNSLEFRIPIRPFPEYNLGQYSKVLSNEDKIPSGGNIIIKRSVIEKIGMFNESIGPTGHNLVGGEDHDFLKRAISKGICIKYYPQLRQWHQILYDRMSYKYMFIKSYKRSFSVVNMKHHITLKPYMFRKVITYLWQTITCFDSKKRMFYWTKLAAALGELNAARKNNQYA